jgi:hypothetical protein
LGVIPPTVKLYFLSRRELLVLLLISNLGIHAEIYSPVGIMLDNQGSKVQFLAEAGNFSLHHHVQNSSGAHPASYPMGTRGSFAGGKATRV